MNWRVISIKMQEIEYNKDGSIRDVYSKQAEKTREHCYCYLVQG